MPAIIPSIIAHGSEELMKKINLLETFSPWAHLDVADGVFAPNVTWQEPTDLETIEGKIKLEIHLMIERPEEILPEWWRVADRVLVHLEGSEFIDEIIEDATGPGPEFGLALLLETPIKSVEKFLPRLKFVHLMSIKKIGYHGEPFDAKIIEKIKELRAGSPTLTISVDGGLNHQNLELVVAAGANRVVVGSAIWQFANPAAAYQNLNDLIK